MNNELANYVSSTNPTAIVFDLDGTLLSGEGELAPFSQDALAQIRSHGIHIIIATARPWIRVKDIWGQLKSDFPIICVNGRVIYDTKQDAPFFLKPLPTDIIDKINHFIDRPIHIIIETANRLYVPNARVALMGKMALGFPRQAFTIKPFPPDEQIIHIYLVSTEPDPLFTASLAQEIASYLGDPVEVLHLGNRWLRIGLPDEMVPSFKGESLRRLCACYHLSLQQTMAIGDGSNDISLFKEVGFAIAPANAADDLKPYANIITNHDNGMGVQEITSQWLSLRQSDHRSRR